VATTTIHLSQCRCGLERIRIPNAATYSSLPLLDVALVAPVLSRLLFRGSVPGRAVQMAVLGVYAGAVAQDWIERRGVRRINFLREFGSDVRNLMPMPEGVRRSEVNELVAALNEGYIDWRIPRAELAVRVDEHLTTFIAGVTGQRVETSTEIRGATIARFLFPFALGACDFLSGDVAIFRDTGVFEPHVIAHEFAHRKGYWKELEAQALAYLALIGSGDPVLVQSARCERLHRQLKVLASDPGDEYQRLVERSGLRPELEAQFLAMRASPESKAGWVEAALRALYDERMRLTGQNGIRDYDVGFTEFLHTFERSGTARQRPAEVV